MELRTYATSDGREPFTEWLHALADMRARARIRARLARIEAGNMGDCKPLRDGVQELRIDHGPGYRVYYAKAGARIVLLLVGGDKRRQQQDIETALTYWQDWQERNER